MDNSASAIAKRKQLEAELIEAQSELEENYYDRSVEKQQEALDKELEDFEEEKNAEIEKWDKYLEQVEVVIADSLNLVQENAFIVYDTLKSKADEYNLTLSDSILTPWQDGVLAVSDYQTTFDTAISSTMDQLDALKSKWQEVIDKMAEAAGQEIESQKQENQKITSAEYKKPKPSTNNQSTNNKKQETKTVKVGSTINAKGAKIYSYAGGSGYTQYFSNDPKYVVIGESGNYWLVRHHSAKSGATGWFKKSDVKALSVGTQKLEKSGLVNVDELGEELVVRVSNGRLTYLEKGSGVIPADLTSNLMQWGELNPQEMLDRNRPQIGLPSEIHNTEIHIDASVAELVHIDKCDQGTLPDVQKIVDKALDKHMQNLNNSLKRFTR